MKIVAVGVTLGVLDDDDVSKLDVFSEVVQAGYEASYCLENEFDVQEGPAGRRQIVPNGEKTITIRIRRK